jgi:hypothetical protein
MSKLKAIRFIVFTIILSLSFTVCEAQSAKVPQPSKPGSGLPSKSASKRKSTKKQGPVSAKNVKKKADAKEKKKKREYAQYIRENQKRSLEIQTPVVRDRMKQNLKNSNSKYKAKKKNNSTRSRKAEQKYR